MAADVCRCLGIHINPDGKVNTTGALGKLGADEVRFYWIESDDGRKHRNSLVSESGLYKLIMRSDKPAARAFQGLDGPHLRITPVRPSRMGPLI